MTTTLTLSSLSRDQAQRISEGLEEDNEPPVAVSINETDETHGLWDVVAYFSDQSAAEVAKYKLEFAGDKSARWKMETIPESGWVEQSLKNLKPVKAGRFYLYGSHDAEYRRSGGVSLRIDAGTAFGTGHHGTTEACLLAFERILKRRKPAKVLDVGTGTGVLALAAAKATRIRVMASDIDPEAVRVARFNARSNGLGHLINAIEAVGLHHHLIAKHAPYDMIFANILARPLVGLSKDLTGVLSPNGQLILSGLTVEQKQLVFAAYRNRGLVMTSYMFIGQWMTLTLTKQ